MNDVLPRIGELEEFQTVLLSDVSLEEARSSGVIGAFVFSGRTEDGSTLVNIVKQDYEPGKSIE